MLDVDLPDDSYSLEEILKQAEPAIKGITGKWIHCPHEREDVRQESRIDILRLYRSDGQVTVPHGMGKRSAKFQSIKSNRRRDRRRGVASLGNTHHEAVETGQSILEVLVEREQI